MTISPSAMYSGHELTTNGRCSRLVPASTLSNDSPVIVVGTSPSPVICRMVGAISVAVVIASRRGAGKP